MARLRPDARPRRHGQTRDGRGGGDARGRGPGDGYVPCHGGRCDPRSVDRPRDHGGASGLRWLAVVAAVVVIAAACGRGNDDKREVVPSPAGTPPVLGGAVPSATPSPSPTPTRASHSSGNVSAEERRTPAPARISLAEARVKLTRIATLN